MSNLKVLIIGGGPCGLAAAQGLKRAGIDYEVFERETGPRGRNWAVTIGWSLDFLEKILPDEIYSQIPQCQPEPDHVPLEELWIRNGATSDLLLTMPVPGVRRMNMQKVKKLFSTGLNITYGKKFDHFEVTDGGVTVYFDDGSTANGTIVLGAEGGQSRVRRALLPPKDAENEELPFAFMNVPVSYTAEQARYIKDAINPNVDVGIHPDTNMYCGVFVLDIPDKDKPETWKFYILASWPKETEEDRLNPPNRLERLKARMEGWADPFKSAVMWTPDDTPVPKDELKCWVPKPWNNFEGRATLGGDAAHVMTQYRGQGGNNSFRDAERFVNAMCQVQKGEKTLKDAVTDYEVEVMEGGGKEAVTSRSQAFFTHDFKNYLKSPVASIGNGPDGKLRNDKYNPTFSAQ